MKTSQVRVRIDCIIQYDHEFEEVPADLTKDEVLGALEDGIDSDGAVNILPGAKVALLLNPIGEVGETV